MNHSIQLCVGLVLVIVASIIFGVKGSEVSKISKYDSDFEFEDHEDKSTKKEVRKTWILDPGSDLCHVLKCKKKELCLLEDEFTAVCVNKKDIHANGDKIIPRSKVNKVTTESKEYDGDDESDSDYYDDDENYDEPHQSLKDDYFQQDQKSPSADQFTTERTCSPCPMITKPVVFLCGSDNRTYSSPCRLNYHNCVHRGNVTLRCPGFCPCKIMTKPSVPSSFEEKMKQKKKQFTESYVQKSPNPIRFNNKNKKYVFNGGGVKSVNDVVNSNHGNDVNPQQLPQLQNQLNQKYKQDYYTKPKKVSFEKIKSYNDVVKGNSDKSFDCSPDALESIGNRLLDWFSVIMSDTRGKKNNNYKLIRKEQSKVNESSGCKTEVNWMFDHLNTDGDLLLSLHELFNIKNDHNEKCIKPFIDQCDTDGDLSINRAEWCSCFKKADPPCTAIKMQVTTGLLGGYVPQCDVIGYYKSIQCHSSIGLCWCVDKHGIEYPSTRTRGKPNCGSFSENGGESVTDSEDDDDDDDTEGSGEGDM